MMRRRRNHFGLVISVVAAIAGAIVARRRGRPRGRHRKASRGCHWRLAILKQMKDSVYVEFGSSFRAAVFKIKRVLPTENQKVLFYLCSRLE